MDRLKLTIATTDYDHFPDFQLGVVKAEDIQHNWLMLGHHEIFARFTFTFNREWDGVRWGHAMMKTSRDTTARS